MNVIFPLPKIIIISFIIGITIRIVESSDDSSNNSTCITITDFICSNDDFTILCEILEETGYYDRGAFGIIGDDDDDDDNNNNTYTELESYNASWTTTLFAPNDEAFDNLSSELFDRIFSSIENIEWVVSYHAAVVDNNDASAIRGDDELKCGKLLGMSNDRDTRTICSNNYDGVERKYQIGAGNDDDFSDNDYNSSPEIIDVDIAETCNGIIHVVNRVILPKKLPDGYYIKSKPVDDDEDDDEDSKSSDEDYDEPPRKEKSDDEPSKSVEGAAAEAESSSNRKGDGGKYPTNKTPKNPPKGYFNYDKDDGKYGPYTGKKWSNVKITEDHWLAEFTEKYGYGPWKGHLEEKDPLKNRCDGPEEKQSPKNLKSTSKNDVCLSLHEIRTKCGKNPIDFKKYQRLILPHKLSLVMNRRKCVDDDMEDSEGGTDKCDKDRPPVADFPKYSWQNSAYSDLLHVDIKIPGEHRIENEKFDAEIQLVHTHYKEDRVGIIAIPVRAIDDRKDNKEFQLLIDQFQKVYDKDLKECMKSNKTRRQLLPLGDNDNTVSGNNTTTFLDSSFSREEFVRVAEEEEEAAINSRSRNMQSSSKEEEPSKKDKQKTNQMKNYDPYSDSFMPGMYFYRYDGSLTEPPCYYVTWWVMNDPAVISKNQLKQMKEILFNHVDPEKCRSTSVHNADRSVARPIFTNKRKDGDGIEKCVGNFVSDIAKGRKPAKACRR